MSTQVRPNIVTNGLVLHLDAANIKSYPRSGTTWNDMSGNRNNGTLTNGPTFSSGNGGSIVFDGTDDYVNTNTLTGSLTTTVCVWCKVNYASSKNFGRIVEKGTNSEWTLCLNKALSPATKFNLQYFDSNNILQSNTDIDSTKYQFVAATIQDNGTSASASLYVNGILDKTGNRAVTVSNLNGSIFIGSNQNYLSTASTNGNIPMVWYYSRVLSASEILQNYNATKTRFGLT